MLRPSRRVLQGVVLLVLLLGVPHVAALRRQPGPALSERQQAGRGGTQGMGSSEPSRSLLADPAAVSSILEWAKMRPLDKPIRR